MDLPPRRPDEQRPPEGDATGGVIPYKNPQALIAYYCGVFSLVPCLGVIPGVAGVILGIMGLRYRAQHPETKGAAHAWIGIILGGLMTVVWAVLIGAGIIGASVGR